MTLKREYYKSGLIIGVLCVHYIIINRHIVESNNFYFRFRNTMCNSYELKYTQNMKSLCMYLLFILKNDFLLELWPEK